MPNRRFIVKKFEEPRMEVILIDEIIAFDGATSDDETVFGGGGFGPIIRPTKKQ